MKKHERTQGNWIIFAVLSIKFDFGTALEIFFYSKKWTVLKSAYGKIYFVIQFDIVGHEKFNIYLRYSKLYDFYVYLLCLNFFGTFLNVLGIFTYFNIAKKPY